MMSANTEDFLKSIINISHAWEELLKHLVSAVASLRGGGASGNMLNTDKVVKDRNHVLLEELKTIIRRVSNFYKYPCLILCIKLVNCVMRKEF